MTIGTVEATLQSMLKGFVLFLLVLIVLIIISTMLHMSEGKLKIIKLREKINNRD